MNPTHKIQSLEYVIRMCRDVTKNIKIHILFTYVKIVVVVNYVYLIPDLNSYLSYHYSMS